MNQQPDLFASPTPANTVAVQSGWRRPAPQALCQNSEALLAIADFDFDLSDPGFQAYASRRGVLQVAGTPGSSRWHFTADRAATREEFMADPFFRSSQPDPKTGAVYLYPPEEMDTHWKIMRLAKAKLQDCWELYRTLDQ